MSDLLEEATNHARRLPAFSYDKELIQRLLEEMRLRDAAADARTRARLDRLARENQMSMRVVLCNVNTPGDQLSPYQIIDVPPDTAEIKVGAIERYGDREILVEFIPIEKPLQQGEEP